MLHGVGDMFCMVMFPLQGFMFCSIGRLRHCLGFNDGWGNRAGGNQIRKSFAYFTYIDFSWLPLLGNLLPHAPSAGLSVGDGLAHNIVFRSGGIVLR